MEQMLTRFLKPGTFMFWGLSLVFSAYFAADRATASSSFLIRHLFALALISWLAGIVLVFRLHVRRHGGRDRRRTMFG